MPDISEVLERLQREAAEVRPPRGLPHASLPLSRELVTLYGGCGGALLTSGQDYDWRVSTPDEFKPTNLVVTGRHPQDDASDAWYALASQGSDWIVSVDLTAGTAGRCIDSFRETHGLRGDSPVIALSVAELLARLLDDSGRYPYWLRDGFVGYGDAYGA